MMAATPSVGSPRRDRRVGLLARPDAIEVVLHVVYALAERDGVAGRGIHVSLRCFLRQ